MRVSVSVAHVQLFATPWTVACQVPVSMGFPWQKYWSDLSFPSPEDIPDPRIKLMFLALAGGFFTAEPPGKPDHFFSLFFFFTFKVGIITAFGGS